MSRGRAADRPVRSQQEKLLFPLSTAFFTLGYSYPYIQNRRADVAKLSDAQASEACCGDTVVVQVHSSAFPNEKANVKRASMLSSLLPFHFALWLLQLTASDIESSSCSMVRASTTTSG